MSRYDNAFLDPFIQASRLDHQREMEANQQRRLEQGDRRLADNEMMQAERIKQIRAQIARIQQLTSNMATNGGRSPFNQVSRDRLDFQKKAGGIPFIRETEDGRRGLFVMPSSPQRTAMQKTISSFPPLHEAIGQIVDGVEYMQTNLPKEAEKTFDAAMSFMSGNATDKQEELLSKAGISKRALIQAAETAQNVMGIPRTNEGMHQAFALFRPTKGDTPAVYKNQMNQLLDNFANRYWEAQYDLQGVPTEGVAGSGADEGAALEDRKRFVLKNLKNRGAVFPKSGSYKLLNQSSGEEYNSNSNIPEGKIAAAMKANPNATREMIIKALENANG